MEGAVCRLERHWLLDVDGNVAAIVKSATAVNSLVAEAHSRGKVAAQRVG